MLHASTQLTIGVASNMASRASNIWCPSLDRPGPRGISNAYPAQKERDKVHQSDVNENKNRGPKTLEEPSNSLG